MSDQLLTAEQLADVLQISTDQVKRRTKADGWPSVRFSGKTVRYLPEHVAVIVALYTQAATPTTGLAGQTAASRRRAS